MGVSKTFVCWRCNRTSTTRNLSADRCDECVKTGGPGWGFFASVWLLRFLYIAACIGAVFLIDWLMK